MTHHFARVRRSSGAFLDSLLEDHAAATGTEVEDLQNFEREFAGESRSSLVRVVVDRPMPARGYALLLPLGDQIAARIHVLDGQPDEAYRALFSQTLVQARHLTGDHEVAILLDEDAAAPNVLDAVRRFGYDYGISTPEIVAELIAADEQEAQDAEQEAQAEDREAAEQDDEEQAEEIDWSTLTVPQLSTEIDLRNSSREVENLIIPESGLKADLVAALEDDDARIE